jgi:hypothetical protein
MCGNHTTLRVRNSEVVLFTYCREAPMHQVIRDQLAKNAGGEHVWLRYDIGMSRTNPIPNIITNAYVLKPRLLIMSLGDGRNEHWLIRDLALWKANATMTKCGEPVSIDDFYKTFMLNRKERPTMPSSVPLTRGTPPATQEPRLGSRSAHG